MWKGSRDLLQTQAPAQQPTVLRLHYMNCYMPWVFLDSSSRCGETVPRDSEVNEWGMATLSCHQREFITYQFWFTLPKFSPPRVTFFPF